MASLAAPDIPSLAWGRFRAVDGGLQLPFSVQAHHGFVDGYHIHLLAQQVAALSVGREQVLIAPDEAQAETKEQGRGIGFISALAWPGALRQLDRKSPGYDV